MPTADFIAIDWGTSRLRAWLMTPSGEVRDARESDQGIMQVPAGGFGDVFDAITTGWQANTVWLAGMVGSRNGWVEVPYGGLPATAHSLAAGAVGFRHGGRSIRIVPGLSLSGPAGQADVMRGEEVLCLGAGVTDGLVCLPGTHAKWVTMAKGRIVSFRSFMTGEVYGLMTGHSILAKLAEEPLPDPQEAVLAGAQASAEGAGVLGTLFQARARVLAGTLAPASVRPFIAGLLIGDEIAHAMSQPAATGVTLVASGPQARDYRTVLAARGMACHLVDPGLAFRTGLLAIAGEAER